ncbi:lipase member H-like [Cydia pomonella]|uniref:lipase member H-like n=1 Tax=Cydia pomonella TaxID=82600 RepID=UPI002ADE71D3|nr:lipase member H-like [Cydia pomonella]
MEARLFLVVIWMSACVAYEYSSGTPAGYMSDCPGMNASTEFTDKTRRSLKAVVMMPSAGYVRSRETSCRLSVAGAACAARWLDLKRRRTQVLIAGYLDASFSPVVRSVAGAYLNLGRNVILVEVFPLLIRTYPMAARITRPLGRLLGEFLAELTRRGLPPSRLEISGGSLGAHIAYYASVKYRELTGRKPARLTGLDPAGPCFRNLPPWERFNAGGAERVDALHTNIDGFGIAHPMGHVDFYANGGEFQPSMVGDFIMPCFLLCSHLRSAFYWLLAYDNPDKFIAVRCDTMEQARRGDCYDKPVVFNFLGPKTNHSKPGIYYLPTSERTPYYLGEEGLKKRRYGHNDYLLKTSVEPEGDVMV